MNAVTGMTDALTSMMVPLFLVGGLIIVLVTLFTNYRRRKSDDKVNYFLGEEFPAALAELPEDEYIVLRKQLFMTKLGKARSDYLVVSTHGVFCIELAMLNKKISGKVNESSWRFPSLGGFASKSFASPLWQAKVHTLSVRAEMAELFPEKPAMPCFPMAVFPASAHLCEDLAAYDFVEDDIDEDEYEYVDEDYEGDDVVSDDEEFEYMDDTQFVGHAAQVADFIMYHSDVVMTPEEMRSAAAFIEKRTAEIEHEEDPEILEGYFPEEYREFTVNYKTEEEKEAEREEARRRHEAYKNRKKNKKAAEAAAKAQAEAQAAAEKGQGNE